MTAALERAGTAPKTGDARVGVSILTYNRADEVSRTVERMLALPERPPIVVVDNGSTDGTPELLGRRFPELRCLTAPGNPGAAGRRRTERHAGPAAEGLHPRRQPAAATAPSRRRSFRLIVSPPV